MNFFNRRDWRDVSVDKGTCYTSIELLVQILAPTFLKKSHCGSTHLWHRHCGAGAETGQGQRHWGLLVTHAQDEILSYGNKAECDKAEHQERVYLCEWVHACVWACATDKVCLWTWSLLDQLDWMVRELQRSACLALACLVYRHLLLAVPGTSYGFWGSEVGSSSMNSQHFPYWAITPVLQREANSLHWSPSYHLEVSEITNWALTTSSSTRTES